MRPTHAVGTIGSWRIPANLESRKWQQARCPTLVGRVIIADG